MNKKACIIKNPGGEFIAGDLVLPILSENSCDAWQGEVIIIRKYILILKGKGLYLHASQLEFTHPFTEEKLSIKSTLPVKFKKIIA